MRRNCESIREGNQDLHTQKSTKTLRSPCSESGFMDFTGCYHPQACASGNNFLHGPAGYSGVASKDCDSHEMMFQDPAEVHQWAATSAALPLTGDEMSNDMSRDSSDMSSMLSSGVPENCLFSCDQVPLRTTTPGSVSTSTGAGHTSLVDASDSFDNFTLDPSPSFAAWSRDVPSFDTGDSLKDPFRSADASQKIFGSGECWLDQQLLSQEDLASCPGLTTWSSPSTASIEPSLASSYPHPSYLNGYLSPTCSSGPEDLSSTASLEEQVVSPFALEPAQNFFGTGVNQSSDTRFVSSIVDPSCLTINSTMRPVNGFQRTHLPCWTSGESVPAPMVNPDMYGMIRKPSSDGENTARRSELYQVGPKEDGLYHCPFAKDGCTHKPEKLKCNYDKHLDAHLKPYRCKNPDCVDVPFSSTACLLRHEREAHGMHGHGDKPYLCTYEDCERAVPGNGFPRRWNLQDHMKRVHDYTGTPTNGEKMSSDNAKNASRKKRTSTLSAPKRSKTGTITKSSVKTAIPARQKLSIRKNIQDRVAQTAQDFITSTGDLQGPEHFPILFNQSALPLQTIY